MTDEQFGEISVTETDSGRIRQLIVTIILALLLTVGLVFFVQYGGTGDEATSTRVYTVFVIGIVILGINYINDNVLLELVKRLPVPAILKK